MNNNEEDVRYEHEGTCDKSDLVDTSIPGVKTCADCLGSFDAISNKGLSRFDPRLF